MSGDVLPSTGERNQRSGRAVPVSGDTGPGERPVSAAATGPERSRGDRIDLRIPARGEFVRLARVTASGLGSRLGFTWDEVEDLRLAIDEACHLLLQHGTGREAIHLRYELVGPVLEVTGQLEDPALHILSEVTESGSESAPCGPDASALALSGVPQGRGPEGRRRQAGAETDEAQELSGEPVAPAAPATGASSGPRAATGGARTPAGTDGGGAGEVADASVRLEIGDLGERILAALVDDHAIHHLPNGAAIVWLRKGRGAAER